MDARGARAGVDILMLEGHGQDFKVLFKSLADSLFEFVAVVCQWPTVVVVETVAILLILQVTPKTTGLPFDFACMA